MGLCSLAYSCMAFSFRSGPARVFGAFRDYDNGAGSTLQLGVTTYKNLDDGDQSYQTTYLEWGGRSDHLVDAINSAQGVDTPIRRVSTASNTERIYVASNERNKLEMQTVDVPVTSAV